MTIPRNKIFKLYVIGEKWNGYYIENKQSQFATSSFILFKK